MSSGRTARSALSSLLDPVTVGAFLDQYFGIRPLLIRGNPGKFDSLMNPSHFIYRLDRVAEIRCVFGSLRQATIRPTDIREMYEAGATICVTGIDLAHRSLQSAAKRIEKELGYAGRLDFRAYLSPPGSGFDFHYDARVATTLQLEGTKTWWYSDSPHAEFPTENSSRGDMAAILRAVSKHKVRRVMLRPGDLLCLPPGVWHKAMAGAGGSLALNLAFNHGGATVGDVVLQSLREVLSGISEARQPFYTGPAGTSRPALAMQVDQCVEALRIASAALEGERSLGRLARAARRMKQPA